MNKVKRCWDSIEQWIGRYIYWDSNDQWIGRYRGPNHNYVCIIPCLVIRWKRRGNEI